MVDVAIKSKVKLNGIEIKIVIGIVKIGSTGVTWYY